MSLRRIVFLFCVALVIAAPASAQNPQPYIVGELGGSFGDGGAAPAVAAGFGYLTPRNIGFEIEVGYLPDLDLGDPGFPIIAIFPPISVESSGRLVSLQTHVIGMLPGGGRKLRAFVLAGGGVADVQETITIRGPIFTPVLPGLPGFPDLPGLPRAFDSERTRSETNLVLSAGAGFEYAFTQHLGLGLSVRYQHLFSDPRSLDLARAAVRASWRF